ncbi:hypothetical protein C1645_820228 [Glomus cerebriforme]|uniref:Uncharacterized protein n=1 Tax=Glomus cerebriforme TaxID=658196 RepID=A0A397T5X4_9GLOM|nr:hypothetical protein C1645_820228 [Glomus cerebriforme]
MNVGSERHEMESFKRKPSRQMLPPNLAIIREMCRRFIANFNEHQTESLPDKLKHNSSWKESYVWNNPVFGLDFEDSLNEGTYRETNDGLYWAQKGCKPEKEQFGIVGIQVAGEDEIHRYYHLHSAEIPVRPMGEYDLANFASSIHPEVKDLLNKAVENYIKKKEHQKMKGPKGTEPKNEELCISKQILEKKIEELLDLQEQYKSHEVAITRSLEESGEKVTQLSDLDIISAKDRKIIALVDQILLKMKHSDVTIEPEIYSSTHERKL